jgi:hypothetical protein
MFNYLTGKCCCNTKRFKSQKNIDLENKGKKIGIKGNNPCWELASKPVDHKCASFNCSCPSPSFNFKCVCGLQITLIAVIDNA